MLNRLFGVSALAILVASPALSQTVLKIGHGANESFHVHRALVEFERLVEEGSAGEIDVQIFPSSQMGTDREMIEGVQTGVLEMAVSPASQFSAWEPAFNVVELAYIYPSKEVALAVLNGPEGQALLDKLKSHGLIGLGWMESGMRHITNNRGPITSPEDLAGLKLRTMKVPAHVDTFTALGASPTPMNFGEVYSGLQQGVIDGQENPVAIIASARFQEVQKYLTLSGHVYTTYVPAISQVFFDGLPSEQQTLIQESLAKAVVFQNEIIAREDAETIKTLEAAGMSVNSLTPEQQAAFNTRAAEVNAKYRDEIGADVFDGWMAAIAAAAQ